MKPAGLTFAMLLFSSASLLFAGVQVHYGRQVDFGRYRTYSWTVGNADNSPNQAGMMQAVDSALAAKGWRKVPSGGDATVSAGVATSAEYLNETFDVTPLPGWHWQEEWVQTTGATPHEGLPQAVGWSSNIGVAKELVMVPDGPAGDAAAVTNTGGVPVTRNRLFPDSTETGQVSGSANSNTTQMVEETVRVLTIDMRDRATGSPLFVGQADYAVSPDREKNARNPEHSVARIFKKLP
jgi:hypothetical protein